MYFAKQTLRHKETNELVRLWASGDDSSVWHWGQKEHGKTRLVREDGTAFAGDLKDYTHVEDELGRPVGGLPGPGEYVDTRLKKYLVSPEELADMRKRRLLEWEAELLAEMEESPEILCPFADGKKGGAGESRLFEKWFLERRKSIALHKSYSGLSLSGKGPGYQESREQLFVHQDQVWLYQVHPDYLVKTDLNQLKRIAWLISGL